MQLQFIKPDSGYFSVIPSGASEPVCGVRVPWQVVLDGQAIKNPLHGDDAHLLTGVWSDQSSTVRQGRTQVAEDIEMAAWLSSAPQEKGVHRCQFTLALFNASEWSHASPALVIALELPKGVRQVTIGAMDVQVIDDSRRLWTLRGPTEPAHARLSDADALKNAVPRSTAQPWTNIQPYVDRVRRDLVSITLPMGTKLAPRSVATVCGELAVKPCARSKQVA